MLFRLFGNELSVCTATSAQSRMTTTDSLMRRKPDSEGAAQDTVDREHTGSCTNPIGSSTGSHSGSPKGSTAALSPTKSTADDAHDPATAAPAKDSIGQEKVEANTPLQSEPKEQRPIHAKNSQLTQRDVTGGISISLLRKTGSNLTRQASFQRHSILRQSGRRRWIDSSKHQGLHRRLRWPHQSRSQQNCVPFLGNCVSFQSVAQR